MSSKIVRLGIITVLACTIVILSFQYAEASQPVKGATIYIEKTCQLSKKCLSYTDIKHLDNSPKTIGELVTKDGITKRVYTPKQDNIEWLRFENKILTIIDAPGNIAAKMHQITISSNLNQYILPTQYVVKENKTGDAKPQYSVRSYSHSWYVDSNCNNAVISAHDWQVLLPAMVEHLASNCSKEMPYSNVKDDIKPIQKHDIKTSSKYKLDNWTKKIKQDCLKTRNACTDLKQPGRAGLNT